MPQESSRELRSGAVLRSIFFGGRGAVVVLYKVRSVLKEYIPRGDAQLAYVAFFFQFSYIFEQLKFLSIF